MSNNHFKTYQCLFEDLQRGLSPFVGFYRLLIKRDCRLRESNLSLDSAKKTILISSTNPYWPIHFKVIISRQYFFIGENRYILSTHLLISLPLLLEMLIRHRSHRDKAKIHCWLPYQSLENPSAILMVMAQRCPCLL